MVLCKPRKSHVAWGQGRMEGALSPRTLLHSQPSCFLLLSWSHGSSSWGKGASSPGHPSRNAKALSSVCCSYFVIVLCSSLPRPQTHIPRRLSPPAYPSGSFPSPLEVPWGKRVNINTGRSCKKPVKFHFENLTLHLNNSSSTKQVAKQSFLCKLMAPGGGWGGLVNASVLQEFLLKKIQFNLVKHCYYKPAAGACRRLCLQSSNLKWC